MSGNFKSFTVSMMALTSIAFLAFGLQFAKGKGLLIKRPDITYLPQNEADSRPLYQQLDKREKAVYTCILNGIRGKHQENITLPFSIEGDEYSKLYCLLEKQEPELFYIDSNYFVGDKIDYAQIIYRANKEEIPEMTDGLDKKVEEILASVPDFAGESEKAKYIHDYIIKNCEYISSADGYYSTAYGCLVEGKATCEGYAKAFSLLSEELGLESILVTGITDSGENHAWNQVKTGDKWSNIDVTWDDLDQSTSDGIRWIYCFCADEVFNRTHIADNEYFKPFSANDSSQDILYQEGNYAESCKKAENIVRNAYVSGKTEISIRFENDTVYNDFVDYYLKKEKILDIIAPYAVKSVSLSFSESSEDRVISLYFE